MKVRDIMVSPARTVVADATLLDAVRLMVNTGISGLPVVDAEGRLVGMLTEGDLLRRAEIGSERHRPRWLEYLIGPRKLADEYISTNSRAVRDLMSAQPIFVAPDVELDEVADIMAKAMVKRLPVVEHGKIVGIVSRSDLLRALVVRLEADQTSATRSDEEIQSRLQVELGKAPWVRTGTAYASVKDGVVDLRGVIFHDHERRAIRIAVTNIPGVKALHDHLALVQPITGRLLPPPAEGDEPG